MGLLPRESVHSIVIQKQEKNMANNDPIVSEAEELEANATALQFEDNDMQDDGVLAELEDNDMNDDDMDDDSDDVSDTLQGVLEANNVNLDEAKAFMQNNLASADVIYQIMSENGLSNEDIALLLDLDSASDVENYFEENGIGMDDSDDDMDDSDDDMDDSDDDMDDSDNDMDDSDNDMDDSDNDGISDDTEETLSNLGLEVEDTKDFIVGNLESPEDIFNFAQENGLSNSLLAELFSDINEDDVSAYFESNGFDNDTSDDSEANLMITGQNSDNGSDLLV